MFLHCIVLYKKWDKKAEEESQAGGCEWRQKALIKNPGD